MAKIIVKGKAPIPSQDPARPGQMDTLVAFETEDYRRHACVVPGLDPSDEEIGTEAKKALEIETKGLGKEIEI